MADTISPARIATLSVLEKLRKTAKASLPTQADIPLPVMLDEQCRRLKLDSRDAGLTTELVCGVLRTESRLQRVLHPFLRKPESLPAGMRELLLMAAYELLNLDAIPPRATLHQTVSLARKRFGAGMGGLANAVLRALSQAVERGEAQHTFEQYRNTLAFPESVPEKEGQALADAASLPLWLAEMWWNQYGSTAWSFAENATHRAMPSYRINAQLSSDEQDALRQTLSTLGGEPCGAYGFLFDDTCKPPHAERITRLSGAESAGHLSRQGLGSQHVVEEIVAAVRSYGEKLPPHAPLWDACCGRGGKTCGLIEQGINVSLASDPSAMRLDALRQQLKRLHLPEPQLENADVANMRTRIAHPLPLILVDAPCSGTGTLARNPELRLRLTPERLAEAVRLQSMILEDVWPCLAPGGLLFYATCALNKAENESQMEAFSARHPKAEILQQGLTLPSSLGQDALFLAVIRKGIE